MNTSILLFVLSVSCLVVNAAKLTNEPQDAIGTRGGYTTVRSRGFLPKALRPKELLRREKTKRIIQDNRDKEREIDITAALDLPFPVKKAFDTYTDLPRQPSWSSHLKRVEYIIPPNASNLGVSKWSVGLFGLTYSWTANITFSDRPREFMWESTSGLKNYGRVDFDNAGENKSTIKVTMTLVVPRMVARLFRGSTAVKRFVERSMLKPALENFRDDVCRDCD